MVFNYKLECLDHLHLNSDCKYNNIEMNISNIQMQFEYGLWIWTIILGRC